jgi:hypothetical protein
MKGQFKPAEGLSEDLSVVAAIACGRTVPELMAEHNAFCRKLEETQDDRFCEGEVLGVMTRTEPFHSDRYHERARVFLGPERDENFACEWTSIPWNVFKPIRVSYWVWVDKPAEAQARWALSEAGVKNGRTEEDPYAEPKRWHVWVDTMEDVVRLWKNQKKNKS